MAQILDTGGNLHTLTQFTEDNLKAVRYDTSTQGLDNTQKENARTNIDALGSTQSAVGLSATLSSSGITPFVYQGSNRVEIVSGGFAELGDIVLVQVCLKAKQTIEYNEYRTLAYGFPTPFGGHGIAISASPDYDNSSLNLTGYISSTGYLFVLTNIDFSAGTKFNITGFYRKA